MARVNRMTAHMPTRPPAPAQLSRRRFLSHLGRAFPTLGMTSLFAHQSARSALAQTPTPNARPAAHEGKLNLALVPNDWANYGELIQIFSARHQIEVVQIDVKGDAANAIAAIQNGPVIPDVIDVNFPFGAQAKQQGLLQAYRPRGWAKIPAPLKDAAGFWAGSHFGTLAFEVNTDVVAQPPEHWADLLKPDFPAPFALAGDPHIAPLAINTVFAAALANGGSLRNARPGLTFFERLKQMGRLLPTAATPETIISGATPVTLRWDYQALHNRDRNRNKIKVIIPKTGVLARVFVQGITAKAGHPTAAKLWMDFLFSDEGQRLLLTGYARSSWFGDLARRNIIPAELLAQWPPAAAYARVAYPSTAQSSAAQKVITENWDRVVGLQIGSGSG